MPNVTFDTKYFLGRLGIEISLEKLSDELYKMGFEVEHADAEEIKIEVTPNRPDLLGAVGMARALKYFLHKEKRFAYKIKSGKPELSLNIDPSVKRDKLFMSGFAVKEINLNNKALADIFAFTDKFSDTFGRGRKKLSIGIHNLDVISGRLVYLISKDESFLALREPKPMTYSQILKRNEKGIKYSNTMPKEGYPVLKDGKGTLAFIPIINSERTKVTPDTKNLFIDVTGSSEYLVDKTTDMLACMFMDLSGKISGVEVKYPDSDPVTYPRMKRTEMFVSLSRLEKEIGMKIGFNNVLSLASKMGYEASFVDNKIRFVLPEYRLDIINEQDLVEDIAIAYGYEYIKPMPVPSVSPGALEEKGALFEKLSDALIGMGFSEAMNSYLTNIATNFSMMRREKDLGSAVTIKDAKSTTIEILRTSLLPSLLSNLSSSKHEKMPQRIFEIDMTFKVEKKMPVERYHVAAISLDASSNFNYIKSVVSALLSKLGSEFAIKEEENSSFITGRCAGIKIKGKTIGLFGEVHPEVLYNFGIEEPAVAFELETEALK